MASRSSRTRRHLHPRAHTRLQFPKTSEVISEPIEHILLTCDVTGWLLSDADHLYRSVVHLVDGQRQVNTCGRGCGAQLVASCSQPSPPTLQGPEQLVVLTCVAAASVVPPGLLLETNAALGILLVTRRGLLILKIDSAGQGGWPGRGWNTWPRLRRALALKTSSPDNRGFRCLGGTGLSQHHLFFDWSRHTMNSHTVTHSCLGTLPTLLLKSSGSKPSNNPRYF